MRTKIDKAKFAEAAGSVAALASKDALSPFAMVRLDAAGRNVSLTGSNGDVQLETRFAGETGENGTVVVPGRTLAQFVGSMPPGEVEVKEVARGKVKVAHGCDISFKLPAGDATEFPVMARMDEKKTARISVEGAKLRELLRKVKYAAAVETTRAALAGVNVRWAECRLEMTATDGRRLAHVEADEGEAGRGLATGAGGVDVTLPRKTVELLWALLDGEETVDVATDGKIATFLGEDWSFATKVVEDRYPNWRQVVPEATDYVEKVDRVLFLAALGRVALAAMDGEWVEIEIGGGMITLAANNGISEAREVIALKTAECLAKVAFRVNHRLLSDALTAIDDDDFTLGFDGGGSRPLVMRCSIPWVAVVMPARKEG